MQLVLLLQYIQNNPIRPRELFVERKSQFAHSVDDLTRSVLVLSRCVDNDSNG